MKKLLVILALVITLFASMSVGYCGDFDDPLPWSAEPVILEQNN
jgi:hypothetical protein